MSSPKSHKRVTSLPFITRKGSEKNGDSSSPGLGILKPSTSTKSGKEMVQSLLRKVAPSNSIRRRSLEGVSALGISLNEETNTPIISPSVEPTPINTPSIQVNSQDSSPNPQLLSEFQVLSKSMSLPPSPLANSDITKRKRGRVQWYEDTLSHQRSRSADDAYSMNLIDANEPEMESAEKIQRAYGELRQKELELKARVEDLERMSEEYRVLARKIANIYQKRKDQATYSFNLVDACFTKQKEFAKVKASHIADESQRMSYSVEQVAMKMNELNSDVMSLSSSINATKKKLPKGLTKRPLSSRQKSWLKWWHSWSDY